jgi:hypothetical protein
MTTLIGRQRLPLGDGLESRELNDPALFLDIKKIFAFL